VFVVRPGCAMGEWIRAERAAGRARGGGMTGACQPRLVVSLGLGWVDPHLVVPIPGQRARLPGTGAVCSRSKLGTSAIRLA
jgi:hypothetical protein